MPSLKDIRNRVRRVKNALLRPEDSATTIFRPYEITPTVGGMQFRFLIPDAESVGWYDIKDFNQHPELQALCNIVKPGFNILEIGVHNGFHAALFHQLLGESGRYFGIELMPSCYLTVLAQLKLNKAGDNFNVMNAAAGDKNGFVTYADIDSGNGFVTPGGKGVSTQQVTGDSLLPYFQGKVDFLKIDVEGYEAFVMEGCRKILAQSPNIALELHFSAWNSFDTNLDKIFKHINLSNYFAVYFCNPNSGEVHTLKDPMKFRQFSVSNLPAVSNMNVFLLAKSYFPELPQQLSPSNL